MGRCRGGTREPGRRRLRRCRAEDSRGHEGRGGGGHGGWSAGWRRVGVGGGGRGPRPPPKECRTLPYMSCRSSSSWPYRVCRPSTSRSDSRGLVGVAVTPLPHTGTLDLPPMVQLATCGCADNRCGLRDIPSGSGRKLCKAWGGGEVGGLGSGGGGTGATQAYRAASARRARRERQRR